ncbi:MAG: BMP family ABC transporter substrate-binding protein [Eubacteriales bacterium]|nr:BMP family ABC transporter substrate-binding protein [Eubacteriales bacterium]
MKKFLSLVLAMLMVFALVACEQQKAPAEDAEADQAEPAEDQAAAEQDTPADEDAATDEEAAAPPDVDYSSKNVTMITDEGGINDESFNQSAWNGMERLKNELNVNISFIESHKDADYTPNLEMSVDQGNDLIWGIGFLMKDAVDNAARDYPEQLFGLIDDNWEDGELPNTVGVQFKAEQSSFLVGYIAGLMTESNKVGMVIGMEFPTMFRFRYGYEAGVNYAAKELGKEIEFLYTNIESFSDTAKAKASAQQMYHDGADIVFQCAGLAGNGVIEAAKELDKWAIGVDLDQNKLAPDNVLTSALKNIDIAIFSLSKRIFDGEDLGGTTVFFGLEEGGVGIAPSSDKHVPAEILEKVSALEKKIAEGEIEVPFTEDMFKAFTY